MLDDHSKADIEKISHDILKQSKALDVFPTPINIIREYTELRLDNHFDLSKVDRTFFERVLDGSKEGLKILQSGLSKVKGFFDRSEKTIYIDANQNGGRKNFVELHEIGHSVLPWQNEVMLASDNDETLLESFEDQFEAEANYFASITLFQHDRFVNELSKLPLDINSAMSLAKTFGSSVHSALRNYVLKSRNKCALLVLTPISGALGNSSICDTRDLFYSVPFQKEFGELELPNEFGFKWNFIQDYKFKKKINKNGEMELITKEGEVINTNYHFFNNTYNLFVFIFPKGEKNKSRTKIILENI